ncbi:uncharacterized protein BXZ73DRAFT_53172 [Epithele typhae]|uniref:uncharacterized protein n=1 Tax=Epithele typhae TaxID=378194 RepID=UPI002008663C|nr:uncharacterized protein BXZ73DRAFT_53172 [Epithele typhae]KAH9917882.1 hypothetical protein BXZ73DRAFT_53172 [Epithele typhae]
MSKRALSPAPLPPAKRSHDLTAQRHPLSDHRPHSTFDTLLFDEIILVIFSYLSSSDLCAIQRTNRNWSRLSLDNQLWKSLYIREYGRMRLRGVRGFIGREDGREMRPLPGRAKADSESLKDWKWMFRISSNWRTGRCSVEHLDVDEDEGIPTHTSDLNETSLLLTGNVTIAAASTLSETPRIVLSSPVHIHHTLPCPSQRPNGPVRITSLVLDQSPPEGHTGRFIAFLSSGEFALFSFDHQSPSQSRRVFTYIPSNPGPRTTSIIQAVYHHPFLVTLSRSFHLSIYELSMNSVTHQQTLSSYTSYPPSSLVLSVPTPNTYKVVLAYAVPVYPAHWSVGATELIFPSSGPDRMRVTSTRTTRAVDVPQGWLDEHRLRTMREQWGRKVARVADLQTDGKWVVLAPGQHLPGVEATPLVLSNGATGQEDSSASAVTLHSASGLQLYRLHLPASGSTSAAPKITFVRTLHGQTGPVCGLALADGRCVSLGVNGSVWVWDLEGGTGTEVGAGIADVGPDEEDGARAAVWEGVRARLLQGTRGAVLFDDRRIVSAGAGGVQVRRFDI